MILYDIEAESEAFLQGFLFRRSHTHRVVYPGRPDEGGAEQRGQLEQQAQRALQLSTQDEEDSGDKPVVAWVLILPGCWRRRRSQGGTNLEKHLLDQR